MDLYSRLGRRANRSPPKGWVSVARVGAVIRILKKMAAFVRWLFSSEQLPTFENRTSRPGARSFARWLAHVDKLGEVRPESTRGVRPPRFWSWLISAEALPSLETGQARADRREGLLRRVLSPESCPHLESAPAAREPGFARWVLSADECPQVEDSVVPRGGGFTRWLLRGEECPEAQTDAPPRARTFWRWLLSREGL